MREAEAGARRFGEGAAQVITVRKGDRVNDYIEAALFRDGFGELRDVFVLGYIAVEQFRNADLFRQVRYGFLLSFALIREQKFCPLAMECLGDCIEPERVPRARAFLARTVREWR